MTEQQQAQQSQQDLNGSAAGVPPAPAAGLFDVTNGERVLAGVTILFALFLIFVGADILSGGRLTGMAAGDDGG